jgi:hypothetical protein
VLAILIVSAAKKILPPKNKPGVYMAYGIQKDEVTHFNSRFCFKK